MISYETLTQAIARGVITAEQADRIRALASADAPPQDEEKLRFITGFGDIFVTIGIVLFTSAIGLLVSSMKLWAGPLAFAAANWAIAEYFTRKRRLAFPSIASAFFFALGCYLATITALGTDLLPLNYLFQNKNEPLGYFFAAISLLPYYFRFRVPIIPAMILSFLFLSGYTYSNQSILDGERMYLYYMYIYYITPFLGVLLLITAIRLDYLDQGRKTTKSDSAFWLHMIAAPLIVHPIMLWTAGEYGTSAVEGHSLRLALFFALTLIAILVNRRAVLVSSLFYAFNSIAIIYKFNVSTDDTSILFVSLGVLGTLILALSAGWKPIRRTLLTLLPTRVRHVLPQAM